MGYYTDYKLSFEDNPQCLYIPDLEEELEERTQYSTWEENDSETLALWDCKWYDHEEDMLDFSKRYPEATFRLEGKGEDADGDLWVKWFKDGRMQRGLVEIVLTYPKFDPSKLE